MSNSCLPDQNIYPGLDACNNPCAVRFLGKETNELYLDVVQNYYCELINMYGQKVNYYVNTYNTLSADNIYGEETTKIFANPIVIDAIVNLSENALILQQHGFNPDDEFSAIISISAFYSSFASLSIHSGANQVIEPKAGDIIGMYEYGNDRPGDRGELRFELTERLDQDAVQINPLMGHYVWLVKGKRITYSFEPGMSAEKGVHQVFDDSFSGRLSGGDTPATEDKQYNGMSEADHESSIKVLDMNNLPDSVYGDY